jgi:outer membrane protein assembly factor BamB
MKAMHSLATVMIIGAATTCTHVNAAENENGWYQWRGPNRDGLISGSQWPASLTSDNLKRIWRVEMGPGYSGPIVVGDRVFVTETEDEKTEVVRALDRTTGNELWRQSWPGAMSVPFFARSNGSWIRATPAFSDGKLYVAGMRDVLVCLNAADGKEDWRVDFVERFGTPLPSFGFVSSPLVQNNAIFVQAGAALVKLDKRTGETIWRSLNDDGGMWGSAFSSPYLCSINDRDTLLVQTRTKLAAVNPDDGAVWWTQEIPAFRGMNILTPTLIDNKVFTSSYGGRSFLYTASTTDDGWAVDEVWNNKVQGYMSSPVVIDGHIYLHLRNQRFTCIDAATGESKWTTKPFGKYWSLVANGKQILALDEQGDLRLIEANPEAFTIIGQVKISDAPTWAHLAVVDDFIVVRELNAVSAFQWTK